MFSNSSPG
jgi:hypothetical protein